MERTLKSIRNLHYETKNAASRLSRHKIKITHIKRSSSGFLPTIKSPKSTIEIKQRYITKFSKLDIQFSLLEPLPPINLAKKFQGAREISPINKQASQELSFLISL